VPSDHPAGDAPGPRRRAGVASGHAGARSRRVTAMVVLGGIAAALMGFEYQFRHLEAYTAAHLFAVLAPTMAASSAPILWFGLGAPGAFGLVITPIAAQCCWSRRCACWASRC
jgi:hypothetical protein